MMKLMMNNYFLKLIFFYNILRMIKNILGVDFKYEDDKMYKINKKTNKWSCCNDVKSDKGYIRIGINKKLYTLHRLIYKYHNEEWDLKYSHNNQIDHIDINKSNNKIENLRVVNNSINQRNKNKLKNCSSIYKGVHWDKTKKKWVAQIRIDGKTIFLGHFKTEEEAHLAYQNKFDTLIF